MLEKENQPSGFFFACTNSTQNECLSKMLFGSSRPNGAVVTRIKKGDILFLLNLEADILYGIFRSTTEGKRDIDPKAWGGNYPYQVKVEAVGEIAPILKAKKLLREMGLSRNSVMGRIATLKLADFFRPLNVEAKDWRKSLFQSKGTEESKIAEPRNWNLLGKVEDVTADVEEIPILQATTMWDFPRQSYGKNRKGDNKYAGVTPAELIWNLVWRYTEIEDLVVDPMCGSGTTIDVCKEEKRRVIGYDISPPKGRNDIIKNDARKIPLETETVDLVFIDSPYGDNIKYNNEPANIGNISAETNLFYDQLEIVMKESLRILKPGKVLGWLIGDQWVKKEFTPVGFKVYDRLVRSGFDTVDVICINRRGQFSHTAPWFNRARKFNFYLRGFKYLFIMRKPQEAEKQTIQDRKVSWAYYPREKSVQNAEKGKESSQSPS